MFSFNQFILEKDLFDKIKVQKTSAKEQFYTAFFVISTLVVIIGIMLSIQ